jgi:hypothetical protein
MSNPGIKSIRLNQSVKLQRAIVDGTEDIKIVDNSDNNLLVGYVSDVSHGIIGAFKYEKKSREDADASLESKLSNEEVARTAAVSTEESTRASADTSLESRLGAEEVARANDVGSLDSRLGAEEVARANDVGSLDSRLGAEESTRASVDFSIMSDFADIIGTTTASIDSAIDAANSDRVYVDTSLREFIISADASLNTKLIDEQGARMSADASLMNADTSLESRLGLEESTRASVDTSLESRLGDEEVARANAITAEQSTRVSVDTSLETRLSNEEVARASVDTHLEDVDSKLTTLIAGESIDFSTLTNIVGAYQSMDTNVIDHVNTLGSKLNGTLSILRELLPGNVSELGEDIGTFGATESTA